MEEKKIQRVCAVNDLSGVGRGSMIAVLSVLYAMGIQCSPVPTAILSAHTGVSGYTFLDFTDEMKEYIAHFRALSLSFDAIYSGFLGSEKQIGLVHSLISSFKRADTLVLVDPVMGDNGRRYKTCTAPLCEQMKELVREADIITPNLTEAAILLNEPLDRLPTDKAQVENWISRLLHMGPTHVVITSLDGEHGTIGTACKSRSDEYMYFHETARAHAYYPGTGDLFASVLLGKLLNRTPFKKSVSFAADFVTSCVFYTMAHETPNYEGVLFEHKMHELIE